MFLQIPPIMIRDYYPDDRLRKLISYFNSPRFANSDLVLKYAILEVTSNSGNCTK